MQFVELISLFFVFVFVWVQDWKCFVSLSQLNYFFMFLEKNWLDKPNPETLAGWKFEYFFFFFFFRRATKPFLRRKKRRLELEHFMEMFFLDWISWISDFEPKEKGFASISHCEEPIGLPRSPVFSKWVWLMWKLLFDWCDRVRLDLSEEAVRLGYLDNR